MLLRAQTTGGNQMVLHMLDADSSIMVQRTPESEARLADIEQQLATLVISDEYRAEREGERQCRYRSSAGHWQCSSSGHWAGKDTAAAVLIARVQDAQTEGTLGLADFVSVPYRPRRSRWPHSR